MSAPTANPPSTRLSLPGNIRLVLGRLARKDLRARVLQFPLLVAIVLPLFWVLQALVDLVFNLSWGVRLGFLIACAALVVWLLFRFVIVPIRRRLSLRSAALLVERKFPQFRTSLISVVDFTSGKEGISPRSAPLVQLLIGQVGGQVDRTDIVRGIVDTRPLKRLLAGALVTAAVVAGIVWYFQPQSLVLARRVFLSHDRLPSQTTVTALTQDFTLNTGSNVELAARAQGVVPRNGRLAVVYADGHRETIPVSANPAEPGVFRINLPNILQSFRYHFEINDGASPVFEVKTRTLPSLASTRFIYLPPSYTGLPEVEIPAGGLSLLAGSRLVIEAEATQPLKSALLELKGLDQTIPMDNGNAADNLRTRIKANEAQLEELKARVEKLRVASASADEDRKAAQKTQEEADKARQGATGDEKRTLDYRWEQAGNAVRDAGGQADIARENLKQASGELDNVQRQTDDLNKQLAQAEAAPPTDAETLAKQKRVVRAEIPIPDKGLTGLSMHLVDQDGLASENDPVYRVSITVDKPPTVEVTEPKSDRKTALAGDQVTVKFRVRDDYRIERILMRYIVLRPDADGEAVPAEEQSIPITFPEGATTVVSGYVFDLASFVPALTEGCSLNYWIEAADHYTLYGPGAGVSRKKIIEIVSPEEKKAELKAEMAKAAKLIENLSGKESRIHQKTDSSIRR